MITPPEAPHEVEAADACPTCRITVDEVLERFPAQALFELQSRTTARRIAAGDVLLRTGEEARVLHLLREGRMKVRAGGRVVKICRAGEVLGGGAVAAGSAHSVDIIALDDCHVDSVVLAPARLRALVVSAIARCAGIAHRQPLAHAMVISAESIARLARMLAGLGCFAGEGTADGLRVPLNWSHQHIGQLLALPETAIAHIFEELEARGILYTDATGITFLEPMTKETTHEANHHSL